MARRGCNVLLRNNCTHSSRKQSAATWGSSEKRFPRASYVNNVIYRVSFTVRKECRLQGISSEHIEQSPPSPHTGNSYSSMEV